MTRTGFCRWAPRVMALAYADRSERRPASVKSTGETIGWAPVTGQAPNLPLEFCRIREYKEIALEQRRRMTPPDLERITA
jgi:hypothetical protein